MYYNTLDNVFRCYQNTGWTNCIGSGGSSDLQTTYATDADGSNATISLTAADDGLIITNPSSSGNDLSAFTLQVSQLNTTAVITTLDLVQASNAANAVDITANSIDTEVGLTVTANALTSGKALTLASSSTAFTGSLANFTLSGSNASNTVLSSRSTTLVPVTPTPLSISNTMRPVPTISPSESMMSQETPPRLSLMVPEPSVSDHRSDKYVRTLRHRCR
jgi:hypothetical protein